MSAPTDLPPLSREERKDKRRQAEEMIAREGEVGMVARVTMPCRDLLRLLAQLDAAERLAPLCEEHGRDVGGSRSGCPYCGIQRRDIVLSRIDYLLGSPNEMECSLYDVDYSAERVVAAVKERLDATELRWTSEVPTQPGWYWFQREGGEPQAVSIDAERHVFLMGCRKTVPFYQVSSGRWCRIPTPGEGEQGENIQREGEEATG